MRKRRAVISIQGTTRGNGARRRYLSPVLVVLVGAGVLALGIHYGTYCSEVYRSGLANIPRGQWEASTALNLSGYHTFRDVIIPQAIPPIVPALGNYLVALFKETPLLSAIAVLELMQTAKILGISPRPIAS